MMPIYINDGTREKKSLREKKLHSLLRVSALSYCVPGAVRARSQIYTQIYRVAFRKIKRPLSLSLSGSSRGLYNDDGQAIIARRCAGPKIGRPFDAISALVIEQTSGEEKKRENDSCGPQVVCMKLRSRRCRIYERKCTVCYPTERDRLVIPFVR